MVKRYLRRFAECGRVLQPALIQIKKSAVLITVDFHFVRHERVERDHLASGVSDDLRVGIAPQEQVAHECFPEREARHLRVWLVVQQTIEWVFERFLFPAAIIVSVYVQRQTATVSDRILTQEYTAVICIAVVSFTGFPLDVLPKKKL
jgi:hypothetical protein